MSLKSFSFFINKDTSITINIDNVSPIIINGEYMKTFPSTEMISLSIASNSIIFVLYDPDLEKSVREAMKPHQSNNIVAYSLNGEYLWNIADIIGTINFPFTNGFVVTKKELEKGQYYDFDIPNILVNHEYYSCTTMGDAYYLIDITDKKVIYKYTGKM